MRAAITNNSLDRTDMRRRNTLLIAPEHPIFRKLPLKLWVDKLVGAYLNLLELSPVVLLRYRRCPCLVAVASLLLALLVPGVVLCRRCPIVPSVVLGGNIPGVDTSTSGWQALAIGVLILLAFAWPGLVDGLGHVGRCG